ncbi:MAG TPA: CYTH and CHAD domain-containing protein [Candidatus Limnocylindria bacterium]
MTTELELKFAVGRAFAIPDLVGAGSVSEVEPIPIQELRATYYDTVDRRLARWGITLRHRTGEGDHPAWTLKLPTTATAVSGVMPTARHEMEVEGEPGDIPEVLIDLVTAHVRSHPLAPAAVLATRRAGWRLLSGDGHAVADLTSDEVTVLDGGDIRSRFSELELEAHEASLDDLTAVTDRLLAAGAVGAEPIPKAVRALGPTATGPPDVVVPTFGPEDPAGWAVRAALADGLIRILRHDPGTRMGSAEDLHQLRVGVRRLRSDLRTLAPLFALDWARGLDADLRELAARLGTVRDLDVLVGRMASAHADLAEPLGPMLADLHDRHERARTALLEELRSDRYAQLLERLVVLARDPDLGPESRRPSGIVLPELARQPWTRLKKRADALVTAERPADTDLHRTRIAAKRARYAAETAARGLDPERAAAARAFGDELGLFQDLLGRHQDAVVASDQAHKAAEAHEGDLALIVAAGRVMEREAQAAEDERRRVARTWARLRRRRNRRWMTSP